MSSKWITPVEPPKQKILDSCATCKFYHNKMCRRYPKRQSDYYPIAPSDWCGEFKEDNERRTRS